MFGGRLWFRRRSRSSILGSSCQHVKALRSDQYVPTQDSFRFFYSFFLLWLVSSEHRSGCDISDIRDGYRLGVQQLTKFMDWFGTAGGHTSIYLAKK